MQNLNALHTRAQLCFAANRWKKRMLKNRTLHKKREECGTLTLTTNQWLSCRAPKPAVVSKLKCPVFVAHDMSGLRSMDRRRRGCGKVGIPRPLRDFQAQWEPCLWVSTERLFHSLSPAIPLLFAPPRPSLRVVTAHDMRPVPNTPGFIQMFADRDRTSRQGSPPARRLDLEDFSSHHDRIIPVHHALLLHREHHVQILSPAGQKCAAPLQSRDLKPLIEFGHVLLPEKPVRLLQPLHSL